MAFFIDDSWKIAPRLTLSLGLRYENNPPYYDKYHSIVNAQLSSIDDPARHPVLVRPGSGDFYDGVPFVFGGGIQVARGSSLMGRSLINRDNNDFAPRLGLAYSPTSKWTIRSGFGVFYVQDAGNAVFDLGRNVAGRLQQPTDSNFPDLTLMVPFRDIGGVATTVNTPYVLAYMQGRRTPYVLEYTLNLQR
jgi:TonB dependent receptor-like, beta-barrel